MPETITKPATAHLTAKELRIGNWVQIWCARSLGIGSKEAVYSGIGTIVACIENLSSIRSNRTLHLGILDTELFGIPLTPEILEKAGFEYTKSNVYNDAEYKKGEIKLDREFQLWADSSGHDDPIYFGKPTKYVHELQNLYFALTGEELNIQLC